MISKVHNFFALIYGAINNGKKIILQLNKKDLVSIDISSKDNLKKGGWAAPESEALLQCQAWEKSIK